MATPKKYIHDRVVLLLLTANSFFAVLTAAVVLWWRLSGGQSDSYIIRYRPTLGLSAYQKGNAIGVFSFAAFVLVVLFFNILLSVKIYPIRRYFALTVLMMALLLIILALFISFALLRLR